MHAASSTTQNHTTFCAEIRPSMLQNENMIKKNDWNNIDISCPIILGNKNNRPPTIAIGMDQRNKTNKSVIIIQSGIAIKRD